MPAENPCELCVFDNPNINIEFKLCEWHCHMGLGELFTPREPRDSFYMRHNREGDCVECPHNHWFRGCECTVHCVKEVS